jgi:transposase
MARWRVRMCPACGHTDYAGRFKCLDLGANWSDVPARRECPRCGYINVTRAFKDVRERHTERYVRLAEVVTRELVRMADPEPEQMRMSGGLWEPMP